VQNLEDALTKDADPCQWRRGIVRACGKAGFWRYSGGGYCLLLLPVEDVSGEPFDRRLRSHPIGIGIVISCLCSVEARAVSVHKLSPCGKPCKDFGGHKRLFLRA
jgi:hypothetical protein